MKIKKYSDKDILNQLKGLPVQIERTPADKVTNAEGKESNSHYNIRLYNLSEVQKEALLILLKNKGVRRKYSGEVLLNLLRDLAETLGRTPAKSDIDKAGKVSSSTYMKHFGSICKAQEAAGLVPNKNIFQRKYSDEFLLNHLRELAENIGRTPSTKDISNAGIVSPQVYIFRFGCLSKAQKAAGLIPNKNCPQRKYSDEFLLGHLKELAKKLGRTPNASDIYKQGDTSSEVYTKRFGSLSKAQKAAGLIPNKRGGPKKYTNEFLLNYLKELAVKLGRTPYIKDIIEAGEVSCHSYVSHFGLFSNAVKAAGLVPNKTGFQQKYTDEYLLIHLKELAQKLGRTPNNKDLNKPGVICSAVYVAYFGSINKAVIAAGLVPNKRGGTKKYTDEFLLNYLKELAKKLGRMPAITDIIKAGDVSHSSFTYHFGSLGKARQVAGLVPYKVGYQHTHTAKQSH